MVYVNISRNVAEWLLKVSIMLFQDGYNTNWHPNNPEMADFPDEGGFVDLIPLDDPQARAWINTLMSMCRCLAAILNHQLADHTSELNSLEDEL
jgi:hypothetical protein